MRFDLARWCEGCGKFKSIVGFGVSQRLRGQSQPLLSERSEIARPVHILGGLPTEPVNCGFDRIREVLRVYSLAEFVGGPLDEWTETAVLLPPSIETSEIVANWEACDFLAARFGRGAQIGNVTTVVDAASLVYLMNTSDPISSRGWGKSHRDLRAIADIAVGQIESATQLLLVGGPSSCESIGRILKALNPRAVSLELAQLSDPQLRAFLTRPRGASQSPRTVPPWAGLLQSESEAPCAADQFIYHRSRPFDPQRFADWIEDCPREVVRGKGKAWLSDPADQSFGYSCAGSVHRLFAVGRWWVDHTAATWPTCDTARRRLLQRWHPQFGDRQQEIAFVGIDLDVEKLCSGLDDCLLSEKEALEVISNPAWLTGTHVDDSPYMELH